MNNLVQVQRGFLRAILGDGDPSIGGLVRSDELGAAQRIAIYRNNVLSSVAAALTAVYPVLERLVGVDYFRQAAFAYTRRYPSQSSNLQNIGERFADYLAALEQMSPYPYVRDVGTLEWARHRAFHAKDEAGFSLARLAGVPASKHGDLCFSLAHSVTLIASSFPVVSIWEANQFTAVESNTVDLALGAEFAATWRCEGEVLIRRLDVGEYAFVNSFAHHQSLSEAIENAVCSDPQFNAAETLNTLLRAGVVNKFSYSTR